MPFCHAYCPLLHHVLVEDHVQGVTEEANINYRVASTERVWYSH